MDMVMGRLGLIAVLAASAIAADQPPDGPQPVGFLVAEVHTPAPVTVTQGGFVTIRLVNAGATPVRLAVGQYDLQPSFVACFLPKAKGKVEGGDVWGPEIGDAIALQEGGIDVTGFSYVPTAWWPEDREGFILLKDEGYARRVVFRPGALPKQALAQGKKIIIDASPVISAALPRPDPDAVRAGKPIRFDEAQRVYAPGARAVEVAFDLPRGQVPRSALPDPAEQAPGPFLDLETMATAREGEDLELVYLVGNRGPGPMWIWQESLAVHRFTWSIVDRDDAVAAQGDGTAFKALADLAPVRPPQVLMPGEFLCVKKVILAGEIAAVKAGAGFHLRGSLPIMVAGGGRAPAPGAGGEVSLAAEVPVSFERRR